MLYLYRRKKHVECALIWFLLVQCATLVISKKKMRRPLLSKEKMRRPLLSKKKKRSPFKTVCTNTGERIMRPEYGSGQNKLPVPVSESQKETLDVLQQNLIATLKEMNSIMNGLLDKPTDKPYYGDIVQATIVAGCPDENGDVKPGNGVVEIVSTGLPVDAALTAVFMKYDGLDGEVGGGGGGSSKGGSGGCYDEAAGVCCAGPCPC